MSFNIWRLGGISLPTPTIEKIIFLSSAIICCFSCFLFEYHFCKNRNKILSPQIFFASIRKSCIFAFANRKEGLSKESAFSPYSDRVNLDNLRSICKVRNKGVPRCSIGLYCPNIRPFVEQFSDLYIHFAGKSRPLHEKIET